jgi:hypothetical protein
MEKKTNIYVFDFGNQIKIGQSGNVKRRLRNIETQSGREAVQTFIIETYPEYEYLLHKLLSEYRGVGEYFNVPFNFAVSILKSLVNYNFAKDIMPNSQLFLPLVTEKIKVIETVNIGMTSSEMAEKSGLKLKTVKKRLEAAKIKPLTKEAVYDDSAYEIILNAPPRGRPKKQK